MAILWLAINGADIPAAKSTVSKGRPRTWQRLPGGGSKRISLDLCEADFDFLSLLGLRKIRLRQYL
jgi:hypothetical protein